MKDLHRRHWEKRWSAKHLDSYMGGRGIGALNKVAADYCVNVLHARSILEIGAGSWRFLARCRELGVEILAGTELPIERAMELAPPWALTHFSWTPASLPRGSIWHDYQFDVVYQHNSIPNMPTSQVPDLLAEMARVARVLVWAGTYRSRFWERTRTTTREKTKWMLAEIARHWDRTDDAAKEISVWKSRRA